MMTDEYLPENEDGECDNDPQIEDVPEPDPECDPQATLDAECLESDGNLGLIFPPFDSTLKKQSQPFLIWKRNVSL